MTRDCTRLDRVAIDATHGPSSSERRVREDDWTGSRGTTGSRSCESQNQSFFCSVRRSPSVNRCARFGRTRRTSSKTQTLGRSESSSATRLELVAGAGASDQSAHQPAPAQRERWKHELATVAPNLGLEGRPVVRAFLRKAPNPRRHRINSLVAQDYLPSVRHHSFRPTIRRPETPLQVSPRDSPSGAAVAERAPARRIAAPRPPIARRPPDPSEPTARAGARLTPRPAPPVQRTRPLAPDRDRRPCSIVRIPGTHESTPIDASESRNDCFAVASGAGPRGWSARSPWRSR